MQRSNCAIQHSTRCWMSAGDIGLRPLRRWPLGAAGVTAVARITGIARSTIDRGLAELRGEAEPDAAPDRVRREGGGRRPLVVTDPTLLTDPHGGTDDARRSDGATAVDRQEPAQPARRPWRAWPSYWSQRGGRSFARSGFSPKPTARPARGRTIPTAMPSLGTSIGR